MTLRASSNSIKPNLRVTYEVEELSKPGLAEMLAKFTHEHEPALAGGRTMNGKDFLSIRDFSPSEIQYLLTLGRQVKAHPTAYSTALRRQTLAMIFEKPSLRTRVTFDVGIQQLGGFSLYLSPAEINLGKRESVYDVAKNLERMVQGIMIRTFSHEIVEQMARYASIPVINGLTDYSHPCQAMADYLTIWEAKGNLEGLKVAFVGDGNNVARSLMFAGAQLGAHVWVATPPGYELDAESVRVGPQAWRRDGRHLHRDQRSRRSGLRRRCDLHRCLGQHGARGRSGEAQADLPAVPGRCDSVPAGPSGMPSFCIACPHTAAMKLPTM